MTSSPIYWNLTSEAAPVLLHEGVSINRSETGFDRMTKKYFGRTTTPAAYANTHFPAGHVENTMPGGLYLKMYCSGVNTERTGKETYVFTVEYTGLLINQAVKRTISSKTQSYNAGSIVVDSVLRDKVQGLYINLACTFSYLTETTPITNVRPTTAPAGSVFPAQPPNPFGLTAPSNAVYNFPWGWVMEGREIDVINNAPLADSIYMIKEDWTYIYQWMPG